MKIQQVLKQNFQQILNKYKDWYFGINFLKCDSVKKLLFILFNKQLNASTIWNKLSYWKKNNLTEQSLNEK